MSKPRKALLIINPISGGIDKEGLPDRVKSRLRHAGLLIDHEYTTHGGHAAQLAFMAIERGYDSVLVAGGDGTVNEVARALRDSSVALGIIPCGSGNGLARHCGMPPDIDRALDIIATRHIINADYGTANGFPFFCTFGMGFDAAVSERFASSGKRGPISYVRSAVEEYISYHPDTYRISAGNSSTEFSAFLVTVANASQYGNNALIAPQASIKDGLLDITVFHDGLPPLMAFAGVELFTGRIDKNILVNTMKVERAVIDKTGSTVHLDGEPMEMPGQISIECRKGALRLYTKPEKRPFRPIITPLWYALRDSFLFLSRPFRRSVR